MRGMRGALLLGLAAGFVGGCGNTEPQDPPLNTVVQVSSKGTDGVVPVGSTGIGVSVPPGALAQDAFLTATPLASQAAVGSPSPGSDSFITGLEFGSSITPLARPVQLQVPLPQPVPVGTAISVFQQNGATLQPVTVVNSPGTFVPFSTSRTGRFFFALRSP